MITKPISTLKVQKLTQEQYDTAFQNGTLDNDSIYLTPTEIKDYALRSDLDTKADLVDGKVPLEQLPDNIDDIVDLSGYYTKTEIDQGVDSVTSTINAQLALKADLVDGKIPAEQLPDGVGSGEGTNVDLSGYYTKTEVDDSIEVLTSTIDAQLVNKADLVDGKILAGQLSEATSEKLGVVKVGSNLSVTTDGTLSANIPSTWDWQFIDDKPSLYTQSEVDSKLDNKQNNNLVTSISEISTDVQYPSAKAVYDQLATKQDTLNLDSTPTANSSNPVTSGGVKTALDGIVKIAEGKCTTYVFDYYDTLYDTLVGENQDTDFLSGLNSGDIFLIRDLTVPDYWWEPQGSILMLAAQEYSDIVVDGYGAARVLETTKIDLADYALKSDIPTKLPANGGNADTIDNYHIRTASEGDKGLAGYITFVI